MIDPNNVKIHTNPLYTPKDTTTQKTGTSMGVEVKQVEPDTVKTDTPKKANAFIQFFKDIGASIKSGFASFVEFVATKTHHEPLGAKLSVKKDQFDATSLSDKDLGASAYATMLRSANKTTATNVSAFERANNVGSRIRSEIGTSDKVNTLMGEAVKLIGDQPLGFGKTPFAAAVEKSQKNGGDVQSVIDNTRTVMTNFMEKLFGKLGDDESMQTAADSMPQDLCNLLALQWKAIDDSNAPDNLKPSMKEHLARDVIVLRSLNPAMINLTATMGPSEKAAVVQLSRAFQSLVNNQGLGQTDLAPELRPLSNEMESDWANHFLEFAQKMVDRADTNTVNEFARIGGKVAPHITEPKI